MGGFIERLKQEIREKPERERIAREAEAERRRKIIEEQNRPAQKTREASATEQSKKHLEISGLPNLIRDLSDVVRGEISNCEYGHTFKDKVSLKLAWNKYHSNETYIIVFALPNGKMSLMPSGSRLRIKTTSKKLSRDAEFRDRTLENVFRHTYSESPGPYASGSLGAGN